MAGQNRKQVVIKIEKMLERANPIFTDGCCIYKVPHEIRKLNPDAYTPKVVSIGPFHHGNKRLSKMETHKQIYCRNFIRKAGTSVDNLVRCVQESELEAKVRQCYSENIDLDREQLMTVILVDCCFIFQFFLIHTICHDQWSEDGNDVIQSTPWLMTNITVDLLLLENQLPFFVLEKLYECSLGTSPRGESALPSFIALTYNFFGHYNRQKLTPPATELKRNKKMLTPPATVKHFTDLIRTFHLSHRQPKRQGESVTHLNSATELKEAGVKFKVNNNSPCLLDLKLTKEYLEIPALTVDDFTVTLFRNMVALEQWRYPKESYITDYVAMLNYLINTDKDVDVLVKHGIIGKRLGDSESVARLFNGLGSNIVRAGFNYCEDHKASAALRRDYCKTPWQAVASAAAIVLLIPTVIQTVFSLTSITVIGLMIVIVLLFLRMQTHVSSE